MTQRSSGALAWTLLALRFLVELALFAAPVVVAVRMIGGVIGVLVGIAVAVVVMALWGVLLSPRRRVDAPLAVRVALEGALVIVVALALSATGLGVAALVLVVVEVVVVMWLWSMGMPPGTDVGATA